MGNDGVFKIYLGLRPKRLLVWMGRGPEAKALVRPKT